MNRTIICLGAKRSGTTAIHRVFVDHPDVSVCHPDQEVDNWEPQFWSLAAYALSQPGVGSRNSEAETMFVNRVHEMAPGLEVRFPIVEEGIFALWDKVSDRYGPILFEKSPQYLGSPEALAMTLKYRNTTRDVRFFALVRDPRDCIASQLEKWADVDPKGTPEKREETWIRSYENLESFRRRLGNDECPVIRYEDLVSDPRRVMDQLFAHCGVPHIGPSYNHVRPVNVSRYRYAADNWFSRWRFSSEIRVVAERYGYNLSDKGTLSERARARLGYSARTILAPVRRGLRALVVDALAALDTERVTRLLGDVVDRKARRMPDDQGDRFIRDVEREIGRVNRRRG